MQDEQAGPEPEQAEAPSRRGLLRAAVTGGAALAASAALVPAAAPAAAAVVPPHGLTRDPLLHLAELLQARCGVGDLSRVFPGFRPTPVGVARPG